MSYASYVEVGFIQRTHGIKGELQVAWNDTLNLTQENIESVFVEIDGIPIPFFINSLRQKTEESSIVKFDDVDDIQSADELVGYKLMLPSDLIPEDDDVELKDLVGYTVTSTSGQTVGIIEDYEEFNLNSIYYIRTSEGKEVIIPATDDLIVQFNLDAKTVLMEIPEGLLDL
jgi:16S rRNA processing protein RimM